MRTEKQIDFKNRLNKAFRNLRVNHRFLAKQNFSCCLGCAFSEASNIIKENPSKFKGVVFYHKQDAASLSLPNPSVQLAWGEAADGALLSRTLKIGKLIQAELETVGLKVKWNGTVTERILVTPQE